MPYAQFAASSQFYLYGRRHLNQTGYQRHFKAYKNPNFLEGVSLDGKSFMVTGANAGVGREITRYLAEHCATVHMVCRSQSRGEAARDEMLLDIPNAKLQLWIADCSLEKDVRRCWEEFSASGAHLDGLVCNAGALLNEKTLTDEGVEVTLAAHLLMGVYLLGKLAMPSLRDSQGRLLIVSSGGMYNTKFPDWETACSLKGDYDGQFAYAYMKRGQVLLAEQWAKAEPLVKCVTCHPGWANTEAVDKAYGSNKSLLEPLRTPWEGAEGMCWLLACPSHLIQSGAFYLDREPQVKHMAGPFFTEGSYTKNSDVEVADMMEKLEAWTEGGRPSVEESIARHETKAAGVASRQEGKLKPLDRTIDVKQFMGLWYIISNIPSFVDKNTSNGTEKYEWDEAQQQINVVFTYMDMARTKSSSILQSAKVINKEGTDWKLRVKLGFVPLALSYYIVNCAEDYSTCIVGDPGRNLLYIMARTPSIEARELEQLKNAAEAAGYDRSMIQDVPQVWDAAAASADTGSDCPSGQ
eukprot:TRINITY_DN43122_c0_g1_i2.p1 TRINITY_DN43122_c0_g1~~TRINITY_DN43122_c0_g1_i2.p1  ORF type:complete len:523 (+),score=79.35 TRINITY_DN43122_c0_g1_i2:77-1645(+)